MLLPLDLALGSKRDLWGLRELITKEASCACTGAKREPGRIEHLLFVKRRQRFKCCKHLIFNVSSFKKNYNGQKLHKNKLKLKPTSVSHPSGTSRLEELMIFPYSISPAL